MPSRLNREFYARHAPEVARDLLGKVLVREVDGVELRGTIVEVEAYTGAADPGSHAFRGPTARNRVMFGPAGHLYVYVSYGMHHCMNVVTDADAVAGAALVRALEPLSGLASMQARRGKARAVTDLCSGPGKLCQALSISRDDNGVDLENGAVWIEDVGSPRPQTSVTTRVGLTCGAELPLRFFVTGNRFVSRGPPAGPRG